MRERKEKCKNARQLGTLSVQQPARRCVPSSWRWQCAVRDAQDGDYVIQKRAKDILNGLFTARKEETFLSKII